MKTRLLMITILLSLIQFTQADDDWWNEAKGVQIKNFMHFKQMLIPVKGQAPTSGSMDKKDAYKKGEEEDGPGSLANTHIIMEFYMEHCHFCREFVDDWNSIKEEIETKYNTKNEDGSVNKKVKFFFIDGIKQNELSRRYKINGFPTFIYLKPGVKGKVAVGYENRRTKEDLTEWIVENVEKHDKQIEGEKKKQEKKQKQSQDKCCQDAEEEHEKKKKEKINYSGKSQKELLMIEYNLRTLLHSRAVYLGTQISLLKKQIDSSNEKEKLFEEEYHIKAHNIGDIAQKVRESANVYMMYKDATFVFIGFVVGLFLSVCYVLSQMKTIKTKKVVRKVVKRVVEQQAVRQNIEEQQYYDENDFESHQGSFISDATGASSSTVQDEFVDDELLEQQLSQRNSSKVRKFK